MAKKSQQDGQNLRSERQTRSHDPAELCKPIKEAVNDILFDKSIAREDVIAALDEAAGDLEGVLDSLRADEENAQKRLMETH